MMLELITPVPAPLLELIMPVPVVEGNTPEPLALPPIERLIPIVPLTDMVGKAVSVPARVLPLMLDSPAGLVVKGITTAVLVKVFTNVIEGPGVLDPIQKVVPPLTE